jgi:hypothetical protein
MRGWGRRSAWSEWQKLKVEEGREEFNAESAETQRTLRRRWERPASEGGPYKGY